MKPTGGKGFFFEKIFLHGSLVGRYNSRARECKSNSTLLIG